MTGTVKTLYKGEAGYPPLLRPLSDTPEPLFYRGNPQCLSRPAVSIVGSRAMSEYGELVAEKLVPGLVAAGLTIVSGLAYGIDGCVHHIALAEGGNCVAVLGGGLDSIYPVRHQSLAEEILSKGGALVSEYPVGTHPEKRFFPARNRIVAGLSQVTLIIEAGETSGTLITARWALQYGRELAVVPGDITREQSQGVHRLLKQGARPVSEVADILALYQLELPVVAPEPLRPALIGSPAELYELISKGKTTVEQLASITALPLQKVHSILSVLELDGYIRRKGYQWQKIL